LPQKSNIPARGVDEDRRAKAAGNFDRALSEVEVERVVAADVAADRGSTAVGIAGQRLRFRLRGDTLLHLEHLVLGELQPIAVARIPLEGRARREVVVAREIGPARREAPRAVFEAAQRRDSSGEKEADQQQAAENAPRRGALRRGGRWRGVTPRCSEEQRAGSGCGPVAGPSIHDANLLW
jgi:hypothetical protein